MQPSSPAAGRFAQPARADCCMKLGRNYPRLPTASWCFLKKGEFADDSRATLVFLVPSLARLPLTWNHVFWVWACAGFSWTSAFLSIHLLSKGHPSTFLLPAKATVPPLVMLGLGVSAAVGSWGLVQALCGQWKDLAHPGGYGSGSNSLTLNKWKTPAQSCR